MNIIKGTSVALFYGNEILLVQRKNPPRQGQWSIPGGHIEKDETPVEAAVREILEETSLALQTEALKFERKVEVSINENKTYQIDLFTYEWQGSKPSPTPKDDAQDINWFKQSDLGQLDISPDTLALIKVLFSSR